MNVSLPLLASRRFPSRALVAFALLLACAPPEVARAQGVFGPTAPTVSPADAVALARCCGGDGGIPIALALQAKVRGARSGRANAPPPPPTPPPSPHPPRSRAPSCSPSAPWAG